MVGAEFGNGLARELVVMLGVPFPLSGFLLRRAAALSLALFMVLHLGDLLSTLRI